MGFFWNFNSLCDDDDIGSARIGIGCGLNPGTGSGLNSGTGSNSGLPVEDNSYFML